MLFGLNRNIWLLALAQPFALALAPAIVLISGFIGNQLAPAPALATLPISIMVVGITLAAMPAAFLMQRFGRKRVFQGAMVLMLIAGGIASLGIARHNFVVFLFGILLVGGGLAVVQQFRFAAVEQLADPSLNGRAISVLMLGSVAAAFIGTELATLGQHWLSAEYAGSFLALLLATATALTLLLFLQPTAAPVAITDHTTPVNWLLILQRVDFNLAVAAATVGYAVMSFVMTATPLAMGELSGHSMQSTKWVIQSHIMAMYLPSLMTGELIRKWGAKRIILLGLMAYLGTSAFAFSGLEVFHYWWALVLLGIGWNFLFIGGTALLTTSYSPAEKFAVQAANDMIVFVFQAIASLSAGAILFLSGWTSIVTLSLIPTLALLLSMLVLYKRLLHN